MVDVERHGVGRRKIQGKDDGREKDEENPEKIVFLYKSFFPAPEFSQVPERKINKLLQKNTGLPNLYPQLSHLLHNFSD